MVDVHDKATRSKNMRAIATRDTAIEKRLASLLTGQGLAFRVQDASLPGRPDFVVDEYRCVIFTHGCFWHHHHCYLFKVPATRTEFWLEKIGKNVERDRRDGVVAEDRQPDGCRTATKTCLSFHRAGPFELRAPAHHSSPDPMPTKGAPDAAVALRL